MAAATCSEHRGEDTCLAQGQEKSQHLCSTLWEMGGRMGTPLGHTLALIRRLRGVLHPLCRRRDEKDECWC